MNFKKTKLISCILAGVLIFTINSSVRANEVTDLHFEPTIDDEGNPLRVQYEFTTEKSPATKTIGEFLGKIAQNNSDLAIGSSYIPTFKNELTVRNQVINGTDTNECWAYAFTSAFQAYNKVKNVSEKNDLYSSRHLSQWANNIFKDGTITQNRYKRDALTGYGNYMMATTYATTGNGPVLESDFPSNVPQARINVSDLNTTHGPQKELNSYINYPSVFKKYESDGSISYYNNFDYNIKASNISSAYSENIDSITSFRNTIKQQIRNNGSVAACIYAIANDKDVFLGPIEDYDGDIEKYNHGVLIVGWDDDYMPQDGGSAMSGDPAWLHKGAYIALNSYGSDNYYDGYIYISYDDFYVEQTLVGITDVSKNKYDNIYFHDELGCNADLKNGKSELTVTNIFNRTTSDSEDLKQVSVVSNENQTADIYYTENFNTEGKPINFKQIKSNISLNPGTTAVDISNIALTKNKFAIGVTFKKQNGQAKAAAEVRASNTFWEYATATANASYSIQTDSTGAFDSTKTYYYGDIQPAADFGIKAYTKKTGSPITPDPTTSPTTTPSPTTSPSPTTTPDTVITSNTYTVKNKMITRVSKGTTVSQFKSKISVNKAYTIIDKNGNTVTTTLMRTGYKVKVGNDLYEISVISDISGSGGNSYSRALDLAKMRAHIVERKGSILTGVQFDAADISGDGKVSVLDLAKLRALSVE